MSNQIRKIWKDYWFIFATHPRQVRQSKRAMRRMRRNRSLFSQIDTIRVEKHALY